MEKLTSRLKMKASQRFDAFMIKVLEPLPCAELVDTQYNLLVRRAREGAWKKAETATEYFEALNRLAFAQEFAAQYGADVQDIVPQIDQSTIITQLRAALVRQLLTPAPYQLAVAWKRKQKLTYLPVKEAQVTAAIEADEAFFAAHPHKRPR